jgi:endonuclease YncB( thermonuclease family)
VVVVVVLLIRRFLRQAKSDSIKPTPVSGGAKSEPLIGDYSREKELIDAATKDFQPSPETKEPFISNPKQTITNLPRYKVEHVIDGDTVVVSSLSHEHRIRLDSIDCPEDGQEWGDIATAGLIKLIGGKHVHLEEHKTDRYERMVATLYVIQENESEWINVNERMVTLGHAWVMRAYYKHLPKDRQDKLNKLERWAKSKKVGLWKSPNPIPPWSWRNGD